MAQNKDASVYWDEFVSDMDSLEWDETSAFPPGPEEQIQPIWKGPRPPRRREEVDYSGADPYGRYDTDVSLPDTPGQDVPKYTNRPELAGKDGWILREDVDPGTMVVEDGRFTGQMDFEGIQELTTKMYGKPMFDVRPGFKPGHIKRSDVQKLEKGEKDAWIPGKLADDGTGIPTNEEDMKVTPPEASGRPPKGYQTPAEKVAFFKENRTKFQQSIYQKIGGNPHDIDIGNQLQIATQKELPGLFNHIFKGRVSIRDINKLDSEETKWWNSTVKTWRARKEEELKYDRDQKIKQVSKMMAQYDHRTKSEEAKVKAIINKLKEDRSVRAEHRSQRAEARAQRREEREIKTRGKPSEATAMGKITSLEAKMDKVDEDAKTNSAFTSAQAVIKSDKASKSAKASAQAVIKQTQKEMDTKKKAIKKQIEYYKKFAPKDGEPITPAEPTETRKPISRGIYKGRKVIKYDNGDVEYDD